MSERGEAVRDSEIENVRVVKVTSGFVELTLRVSFDTEGEFESNDVEIVKAELIEVDEDLATQIYEKVQR